MLFEADPAAGGSVLVDLYRGAADGPQGSGLLAAAVDARPAHVTVFDLLAAGSTDLRPLPLAERRTRLLRHLAASISSNIASPSGPGPRRVSDSFPAP
jgi:hypothetical protein